MFNQTDYVIFTLFFVTDIYIYGYHCYRTKLVSSRLCVAVEKLQDYSDVTIFLRALLP